MVSRNRTAWFGWVTFAAVMLVVLGVLNVLEGLVALLQNQVAFIDGDSLVVVDITGLGVVMIVFGGLLIASGVGLMTRNTVARIAAIVVVALHFLTQVGSLGAYPVWSLLMITLDVIILFALTVHWSDATAPIEASQPPSGTHRADRDLQQQGPGFPVNQPTSPAREPGTPAHEPATPSRDVPAHAAHDAPPSGYQQPSSYQPPSTGYQQPGHQQHMQPTQQPGPNAGPYPPGRPGSPAHAAPTSGYGTGAI